MKRVVVNRKYTYETDLDLKVGDTVELPPGMSEFKWYGTVTSLESNYEGKCKQIVRKIEIPACLASYLSKLDVYSKKILTNYFVKTNPEIVEFIEQH